jgi:hypothetical protein
LPLLFLVVVATPSSKPLPLRLLGLALLVLQRLIIWLLVVGVEADQEAGAAEVLAVLEREQPLKLARVRTM